MPVQSDVTRLYGALFRVGSERKYLTVTLRVGGVVTSRSRCSSCTWPRSPRSGSSARARMRRPCRRGGSPRTRALGMSSRLRRSGRQAQRKVGVRRVERRARRAGVAGQAGFLARLACFQLSPCGVVGLAAVWQTRQLRRSCGIADLRVVVLDALVAPDHVVVVAAASTGRPAAGRRGSCAPSSTSSARCRCWRPSCRGCGTSRSTARRRGRRRAAPASRGSRCTRPRRR